jgi:hypothetical protein
VLANGAIAEEPRIGWIAQDEPTPLSSLSVRYLYPLELAGLLVGFAKDLPIAQDRAG